MGGKTRIRDKREVATLLKNWHDKPEEVIMPEGESIKDVSERSIEAFKIFVLLRKIMILLL